MTATIPRSAASVCISLSASEGGGFSYKTYVIIDIIMSILIKTR